MNRSTAQQQTYTLEQSDFMVTKSDLKGNLIYANRAFMRISGYPEYEIIGKPHHLFLHPDMPKGIFKLLWEHLKSEQECLLYLKDITRDGSYYWVFTNVTVAHDDQGLYSFSCRR